MSKEFTDAAASYFGIDPAAVTDAHLTANADGLTVHFKIRLSDDDMIGIGKRMEERRKASISRREARMSGLEPDPYAAQSKPPSQLAAADPLMAHYHGPDNRMYRNDGTAIPPAPIKGHP